MNDYINSSSLDHKMDLQPLIFTSKQSTEQPLTIWSHGQYACRFAYQMAEESAETGLENQDYLAFIVRGHRCRFVLCDGVSLSFHGEYAARFLGEHLLMWLDDEQIEDRSLESLKAYLYALTAEATKELDQLVIPSDLPIMVQEVLEDKRRRGSEAMFICGSIDQPVEYNIPGRWWVAWQGDCRVRRWVDGVEIPIGDKLNEHSRGRWSTRSGLVGEALQIHSGQWMKDQEHILTIYSDGLQVLDKEPDRVSDNRLQEMLSSLRYRDIDDDISFMEVRC